MANEPVEVTSNSSNDKDAHEYGFDSRLVDTENAL